MQKQNYSPENDELKLCDLRSLSEEQSINRNEPKKWKHSIKWTVAEIEDEAKCVRRSKNWMKTEESRKKRKNTQFYQPHSDL